MSDLKFNDKYNKTVADLDDQHEKMNAYIYLLKGCAQRLFTKSSSISILEEMMLYIAFHFECEEQLLGIHGFPDLDSHRVEHQSLLGRINKFIVSLEEKGERIEEENIDFLIHWLDDHIGVADKEYKSFFLKRSVA